MAARGDATGRPVRVIQSLQRGLAVLDFLAASRTPVRTTDIAAHFDIDKANASRLLNTLSVAGYARRTDGRRFAPGPKLEAPDGRPLEGLIALRDRTHSLLESLVATSGECAHMAVLVGDKVWYVDKVSSPQPLRVDHPVGSLAPLHCTALGKAFLAFTRATPGPLSRMTARTLVDAGALAANLERARKDGFARDDEEFAAGVRCVAAPMRNAVGEMVAAVGLSGPTARISPERLDALGRLVRDGATELSASDNNRTPA